MTAVLQYFWRLSLLQAHPSQVPTAIWFIAGLLLANLALSVVLSHLLSDEAPVRMIATAVIAQQAALAGLLWVGLYLRELPDRFLATFTAWLGCDLLITAIFGALLPLLLSLSDTLPQTLSLVFFFWTIAACANICRHAFNVSMTMGVVIAFAAMLFAFAVGQATVTT